MAKKTQRFYIEDPIHGARIYVSVGEDRLAFQKYLAKQLGLSGGFPEDMKPASGRMYFVDDVMDCGVWFPGKPGAATLAHEAFHVTSHILRHVGVWHSESNEKSFAYHLSWVVGEIGTKVWAR